MKAREMYVPLASTIYLSSLFLEAELAIKALVTFLRCRTYYTIGPRFDEVHENVF